MNLSGKKAVIFGGTSGIGLATTKMLAESGATVTAISRDPAKAGPLPANAATQSCDVLDGAAVTALLNDLAPFDILVSAATGGSRAIGPFLEMDMDGYKASFDKLWGYANVVRYGAKHVTDGGSITLVSGAPARNCRPGQIALSSVGGAVEAMVRAAAREVAPRIRINVVSPGTIDTPMVPLQGAERDALYNKMTQNNLIPRAGTAEEVAEGILFVIKNGFVTGTTVDVDGGWLLA
jgi:NAD(P)-dependent dehydrogenase (short-subunit alcohol dehydrogenase family)